jgi:hypothetical protein
MISSKGEKLKLQISEFKKLLNSPGLQNSIVSSDLSRLEDIITSISVSRDNLDERIDIHQELELDLAWYVGKFEEEKEIAQLELEAYFGQKAEEFKDLKKPQWVSEHLVKSDQKYADLYKKYLAANRMFRTIELLHGSLRRRESMINNICKREKMAEKV